MKAQNGQSAHHLSPADQEQPPTVIEVKNLFFSFNLIDWALQDINVTIHEKDFVGIIGPNGGGKSTFIKLLLGLLKPNLGTISILGKSVRKVSREIGYFPQIRNLDQNFPISVEEVIAQARHKPKIINFPSQKDKEKVHRIMQTLDLISLKDRHISELSGGQRNRVFLARALACEPKILILDEPMAGLDVALQKLFLNTLKSLNKTKTIIIVDHNVQLLEEYVDYFICLNRCIAHGMDYHSAKDRAGAERWIHEHNHDHNHDHDHNHKLGGQTS